MSESKRERDERRAEILVEAYLSRDDRKTAERAGITDRTLRNWRSELFRNPQLSALFREKKRQVSEEWANEVPAALRSAVGFLRRAGDDGDPCDPAMVHAVAGAMKLLSETAATWKLLDARMAGSAGTDAAKDRPAATGRLPADAPN